MKILKLFILASLLLGGSGAVWGCGPWYYSAADNCIYRLLPPEWQKPTSVTEDFETKNILAWSRQSGCKDSAAIREAVYTGWDNYKAWEDLLWEMTHSASDSHNPMTDNAFCRHLVKTHDIDAVRLLCWSKTYSNIRQGQRSPWYYNSHIDTRDKRQLRELYNKLLQYKPAAKYADRYKFLAIKCAWALEEDSAAVTLWKRSRLHQKGNLFYYEARDYAARCLSRMGREKEAIDIYFQDGNYAELVPLEASTPTKLRILMQLRPNAPQLVSILQDYLSALDYEQACTYQWHEAEDYYQTDSVLLIARMAIDNPQVKQKAMWRYVAACVLDFKGNQQAALRMLDGAANGDGNAFLKKSVRILTFYLRSRTDIVDGDYEHYAIGEVKWLDNEMLREWNRMPVSVRNSICGASDFRSTSTLNQLYSYAALRRIVLEDSVGVAWRMAAAGRGVRALQMANVVDNHLFQLSNNTFIQKHRKCRDRAYNLCYWDNNNCYRELCTTSLQDTATLEGCNFYYFQINNSHDFSNGLFCVADIVDAQTLEQYRQRMLHPKDGNDHWFNARSYTDDDYWEDIVGTHCLREQKYRAAAAHLRHISPSYQRRMNISCCFDAFSYDRYRVSHDSTSYKLHFAMRMDSLQQVMHHHPDADSRGLAMLEYSIGLENSFDLCWWLTSYQKGWNGANLTDIDKTHYAKKAHARVSQLRKKALRTLSSDNARASYYLRLGDYSVIRKHYPETETGKYLALVCDQRMLYRMLPNVITLNRTSANGSPYLSYRPEYRTDPALYGRFNHYSDFLN